MVEGKDYVRDVETKDNLQPGVEKDKIPNEFDFTQFDKDVEASFQQFLESNKTQMTESTDRSNVQAMFNNWLDNQLAKLDKFKENAIYQSIVKPTTFELQNFQTASELAIFQQQLQNEKDQTRTVEVITVNGTDLKLNVYNGINKDDIANVINEKNFKDKDKLLNLLKSGTVADVKNFQRIVAGIAEDGSQDVDARGADKVLGVFGVDGKFGTQTLAALNKYITDNKIEPQPANAGERREGGDGVEGAPVVDNQTVDNTVRVDNPTVRVDNPVVTEGTRVDNSGNSLENGQDINIAEIDMSTIGSFDENGNFVFKEGVEKRDNNGKYIEINGKKIYEQPYIPWLQNDITDGIYYHRENNIFNCSILLISQYNNGKSIGERTIAHINGNNYDVYRNGEYYEVNGTKIYELGNNKDGMYYHFDADNKCAYIGQYQNGKMNGTGALLVSRVGSPTIIQGIFQDGNIYNGKEIDKAGNIIKVWENGVERDPKESDLVVNEHSESNTLYGNVPEVGIGADRPQGGELVVENGTSSSENDDHMEQEIQYDAEGYNVEAPKKQVDNDEDAIKYLTVGKSVFFVAKWFGKSGYNEELSIVDGNYEPKDQEKKDLKTLRRGLESCIKGGSTPAEIFSKIIAGETNFDGNKKLQKLAKLYKEYKADQNGNKKGAYFKKVMGLLENYYVRGVNPKGTDWSFKDMYNNELIGVNEDLITKEKKAGLNQDQMNQINEWGGNAVNGANTINRMKLSSNEFSKFREKYGFSSDAETQFAMCLCDLNADGRIDSRDMDVKTGQEMFNIFRDAKVDQKYGLIEKGPMQNILNFAKLKAKQDLQNLYPNTATFLKGIDLNGTDEAIMNQLKLRPLTMQYLRLMLSQSPMDAVNNIMKYGSVDTKLDVVTDAVNDLGSDAADEMIAELMVSPEFEEVFENGYQSLITQGLSDTPEVKQALRPIIAASLLEDGGAFGGGISAGLDWNLGKAGDIAFTLGYGKTPDGQDMLGIGVSYGKSWRLGKRNGVILSAGATGGVGTNFDSFIPMGIGEVGAAFLLNGKKLENTLDLRGAKYLGINGNVGWVGAPARGVSLSYMNDKMQGLTNTYESIKGDLATTLEGVVDWTKIKDKDACIAGIKTKLEERFGKSDDETIQKAAKRIYSGLSYYTVGFEDLNTLDEKTKKRIIESVAENYALQWRNQAINELEGDVHFQRAAIGVEFIAGFYPLPMASISLEWYKNKYVHETQESMENYYRQLASGKDMRLHNEFMSDNGEITQEGINYLNDKLSIANPNLNTPDMKSSLLSLGVDGVKKSIVIPKDLCKYVNIHVNPALKDFIKKDTDGNFVVPANIPVSLLTYSRTGTGKFDLMIGSKNATSNDIMLSANSEFSGNPENFEGLKGEISKDDVNNSVLVQGDEFPMISNCESVDESTIVLNMLPGVKVNVATSDPNIQVLVDPTSGATQLKAPKYGKLIFTKQGNGEYNASFEQPSDGSKQLVVEYKNQGNAISETVDVNFTDEAIDALFTDLEVELSAMDGAQRDGNYVAFMNAAAELGIDGILDGGDYDKAFDALKKILKGKLNDPVFETLKTYIESENITPVAKVMIIDRFKAIFSYNDKLINPYNLSLQLNGRGNLYKQLKGYDSNAEFPLKSDKDYRKTVQDQLNAMPSFKRELVTDLVGMTAFYRLGSKDKGRSYMMTELGGTSMLGGVSCPIEAADLDATRDWFLSNLDKSGVHKELLKNSLLIQINDKLPEGDRISEMSDDILKAILNGGENIDIGGKNITISCNPTYMFYLLGECANESIGVKLGKISISRAGSEAHSVTIDGTQRGLYSNGVEAQNRFDLGRRGGATIGVMVGNKEGSGPNSLPGSGGPNSLPGSGGRGNNNTPNYYGL